MEFGDQLGLGRRYLNDGGDENCKSDGEHANRLILDSSHFIGRDCTIPQMNDNWCKAKQVLCVDGGTYTNARDVRVGGNTSVHGSQNRTVLCNVDNGNILN